MRKILPLLTLLLCAASARATYVGSSSPVIDNTGTATSITITYSPTAGNCVAIGVATSAAATISSVKDNNNVVYPQRSQPAVASSSFSYIYALCNVTSGITSFTVTFTAGPAIEGIVWEGSGYSGIGQSGVAGSAAGSTSGTTSTTTQASNNTVVSMFMLPDGNTPVATAGNMRQNALFHGVSTGAMFDNSSASPASTTNSLTWTTSSAYSVSSVEFSTAKINYTQVASSSTTATTNAQALTFPKVAGDYFIVAGYDGLNTGVNITFTDGGSDSFTQLTPGGSAPCNLATDGDTIGASFAKIGASGTDTVTMANGGTSSHKVIIVAEISGLALSGVLDQTSNCTDTLAVTSLTTSSMSTTSANEIIFAVFGVANALTFTAGANFTILAQVSTLADEVRVVTSTGSYTASITTSTSGEIAGFAATFMYPTTGGTLQSGAIKLGGNAIVH